MTEATKFTLFSGPGHGARSDDVSSCQKSQLVASGKITSRQSVTVTPSHWQASIASGNANTQASTSMLRMLVTEWRPGRLGHHGMTPTRLTDHAHQIFKSQHCKAAAAG